MGRKIRISYDVVTPESVEMGDTAESGWENEEGILINPDDYDIEEYGSKLEAVVALAVKVIGKGAEASCVPYSPIVWYSGNREENYTDSSVKTFTYHLYGFTEEEKKAIYKAICENHLRKRHCYRTR